MQEKLYELTEAYRKANDALTVDEETGEVFGWEELDAITDKLETKVENIGVMYKEAVALAEVLKKEEDRLAKRRQAYEGKARWLKDYLSFSLTAVGMDEVEGARAVVKFSHSEAVEVDDIAKLPEEYVRRKETVTPDKVALKKAIKGGLVIEGAHIEQRRNLSIK